MPPLPDAELSPDIIARWGADLRCCFINRAVERKTGRPPEWFLGKTNAEAGHPPEVCRLWDGELRRVFATGEDVALPSLFPTPRGLRHFESTLSPEFAADGSGRVETVLVVMRDVTRHKRTELALRGSEARFAAFMDHSPAVAYLKDEIGRMIYVNRPYENRFHTTLAEVAGKDDFALWPREIAGKLRDHDISILAGGEMVRFEETTPNPEGGSCHWLSYKFPFEDAEGRHFVAGLSLDVTRQKRAEAERERLLRGLQHANERLTRLDAEKNAFLGICSHDLKNPLSGIIGLAALLKESPGNAAEVASQAEDILGSAEFMLALVNNLLNVAAIEEGRFPLQPERLDLHALAAGAFRAYGERAARKHLVLDFQPAAAAASPAAGAWQVLADRNAALQVLDNLLSNALKFSPPGGVVGLRLRREGKFVSLAVSDGGPGLSATDQARLFEKFTRLSAKPTGGESSTGLGLSIVKRLVDAMHGSVWCESEPGRGTTFFAEFPAAGSAPGGVPGGAAPPSRTAH